MFRAGCAPARLVCDTADSLVSARTASIAFQTLETLKKTPLPHTHFTLHALHAHHKLLTGASAECPNNPFKASTVQCRDPAGVCDLPAMCTGTPQTDLCFATTPVSVRVRRFAISQPGPCCASARLACDTADSLESARTVFIALQTLERQTISADTSYSLHIARITRALQITYRRIG